MVEFSLKPLPEMMTLALGATSVWLSSRLDGFTVMVVSLLLIESRSVSSSYVTVGNGGYHGDLNRTGHAARHIE